MIEEKILEMWLHLYIVKAWSIAKISEVYKVDKETVTSYLKKKIKLRDETPTIILEDNESDRKEKKPRLRRMRKLIRVRKAD